VYALVHPFVQLALLRRRPQDFPWSPLLLALTLSAHWLVGVVVYSFRMPVASAAAAALVGTTLLCVMTVSLLAVTRLLSRAVQTLTALAGADVVLGVVALPVVAWLYGDHEGGPSGLPGLLHLALILWSLAVAGHVLRHALDAPLPLGVVIALVFYVLTVNLLYGMFPGIA
jgi:hypothetical protein